MIVDVASWPDEYADAYDALALELAAAQAIVDRYRFALATISDQESGIWGNVARRALRASEDT